MSKSRIEIVQWREHGDDEDSLEVRVYPADSTSNAVDELLEEHDLYAEDPDGENGDLGQVMYVTTDLTIADGEVFEVDGRKFQVNIKEIE